MNSAKFEARKKKIEERLKAEKRASLDEKAFYSSQSKGVDNPIKISNIPYSSFKG